MKVPAGDLRHRVTLSLPTLTPDGDGGESTSWATLASNVPASIAGLSQSERAANQTVSSESTHAIVIRYLAGVTTKAKVTFGSRTFGIDGIDNVEEKSVYLRLSCTEKVA